MTENGPAIWERHRQGSPAPSHKREHDIRHRCAQAAQHGGRPYPSVADQMPDVFEAGCRFFKLHQTPRLRLDACP